MDSCRQATRRKRVTLQVNNYSWLYVDRSLIPLKWPYNFGLEEFRFPYPVVESSFLRGIVQVESIED